jgi:Holliday junction resolvasome RuvABC DNA-binding subunit
MVAGRLQGVGSGIATEVAAETDPSRCQEIIDGANREALRDIAEQGQLAAARLDALLAADAASDGEGAGGDDAGPEADGSRERGDVSDGPDGDESEGGPVEE